MRHGVEKIRIAFTAQGQVQGVGFRPFLWRLAARYGLSGFCRNTSAGVRIEIQGATAELALFERELRTSLPPLARLTALKKEVIATVADTGSFEIRPSAMHPGQDVLVSPDVAVCEQCLRDVRDPQNPRYGYPFTNCTNCGPRFSITRRIPYDRGSTTMSCFEMCSLCRAEYANPADRRFHAQPIACGECGPMIWHVNRDDLAAGRTTASRASCEDALLRTAADLEAGKIVAIRGLGGFHLACDANNREAVMRLRARKRRPHKALAVMAADLTVARLLCKPAPEEEELLAGPQKPIVLCELQPGFGPSEWICPDSARIGLMLPYTPLHALLFDCLRSQSGHEPLLVMTSGNPGGEPICLGNREALDRLADVADSWLLHNRDILSRVDDSVMAAGPVFLRRARGYVPAPVPLGRPGASVLGVGGMLKSAFCLTRGADAFAGQHIGDLESPATLDFYGKSLEHLQTLLETTPDLVVHDLHPDFLSTRFAREYARKNGIGAVGLQHHAAHAAACLAEYGHYGMALALCLDGSGLGTDGSIWGGELLKLDLDAPQWQRLGRLSPFRLAGGDASIRKPSRLALALRFELGEYCRDEAERPLLELLKSGLNSPLTSSCGRLFDAVSAQLGLCSEITYEGQAAIRLEREACLWLAANPGWRPPDWKLCPVRNGNLTELNSAAIFACVLRAQKDEIALGAIAAAFHFNLAAGLAALVADAGPLPCALTGGVIQNSLFSGLLQARLRESGVVPLVPRAMPPGDGGICLGQAVWGRQLLRSSSRRLTLSKKRHRQKCS